MRSARFENHFSLASAVDHPAEARSAFRPRMNSWLWVQDWRDIQHVMKIFSPPKPVGDIARLTATNYCACVLFLAANSNLLNMDKPTERSNLSPYHTNPRRFSACCIIKCSISSLNFREEINFHKLSVTASQPDRITACGSGNTIHQPSRRQPFTSRLGKATYS